MGKKLFHIPSHSQLLSYFTINNWCGLQFVGDAGQRTTCGRVNVVRRRRNRELNQLGFVMDETVDKVLVRLENNALVWLPNPQWDKNIGYQHLNLGNTYTIRQYNPVRLLFSVDGSRQIPFHRITFQHNTHYLLHE